MSRIKQITKEQKQTKLIDFWNEELFAEDNKSDMGENLPGTEIMRIVMATTKQWRHAGINNTQIRRQTRFKTQF